MDQFIEERVANAGTIVYFSVMKIGFDAKRAFFNNTGLGNYSRSTITSLTCCFPEHEYHLYTPVPKKSIPFCQSENLIIKGPDSPLYRQVPSFWRTHGIPGQIRKEKIDLFHGLSNEIPYGIVKTGIPSVVTIHDIIFIHCPHLYPPIDRYVYKKKLDNAVNNSSIIITVSNQTRDDLVINCNVSIDKIRVVYQGCHSLFWKPLQKERKAEILHKYNIPNEFILNVGTIEQRKNILSAIKAIHCKKIDIPIVIIGKRTSYCDEIEAYIELNKIKNVYLFHGVPLDDLPAFYQQAKIFIYPSLFEGFGIPILEALASGTPVITSRRGCCEEAGGPFSIYVDPNNVDEIGERISFLLDNNALCKEMGKNGLIYAEKFKLQNIASATMDVYKEIS